MLAECVRAIAAGAGRVVRPDLEGYVWFVLSDFVLTQAGFIKDVSTRARPEGFLFLFFISNAYDEW